jgi:hypothetical protein
MSFTLSDVVPWGRSYDEYLRMFGLGDAELRLRMLGCADGPASFNAEGTRRGTRIVSCDPLYQFDGPEIRDRIDATSPEVLEQTRANADAYVWSSISSVEELGAIRMAAMAQFFEDYDRGLAEQRYLPASLPSLPFADASFDLALCSHFLFLYSERLNADFHVASVLELCRVARQVRIFPLLSLDGRRSPWIEPVCDRLVGTGHVVSLKTVDYEFQRGGNQMMEIRLASTAADVGR